MLVGRWWWWVDGEMEKKKNNIMHQGQPSRNITYCKFACRQEAGGG